MNRFVNAQESPSHADCEMERRMSNRELKIMQSVEIPDHIVPAFAKQRQTVPAPALIPWTNKCISLKAVSILARIFVNDKIKYFNVP